MTHFSTDALTRLDDFFKVVVWVAAIVAALALVVVWMGGRELDRRRAAVSGELHSQLAATERAAQRLRQKLVAPRPSRQTRVRGLSSVVRFYVRLLVLDAIRRREPVLACGP
jgi:hypothetical protein